MLKPLTPDWVSSDIFCGIGLKQCKEILASSRERTFGRNEQLFAQGAPVEELVVIASGRVKVTHASPEGDEVILWILGPGETADARIHLDRHACSASAMEDSTALVWAKHRFVALSEQFPAMSKNLGGILSNRLRELEDRFCEVAHQSARQRLAKSLVRLVAQISSQNSGAVRLRLTQGDLAKLTGLTAFTISRLMSQWSTTGILEQSKASFLIRSMSGLELLTRASRPETTQ